MSAAYPPRYHFLRDLGIDLESMARDSRGELDFEWQLGPDLCDEQGLVRCGLLAPMIDIVAGRMSGHVVAPDWLATSDLNLHLLERVPPGRVRLRGHIVRAGRSRVVSDVELETEAGTPVARSRIAYARLPGGLRSSESRLDEPEVAADPGHDERTLLERIGLDECGDVPGRVSLELHDYIRNSLGGLQGGLTALLIEAAALHHVRRQREDRAEVAFCTDVSLHYLNVGRVGPFVTSAEQVRDDVGSVLVESRILDRGLDDRLVSIGTVRVTTA